MAGADGPERAAARAHLADGRAKAADRDLRGAIACYRAAIAADPTFAVPYNALGVALGRAGDDAGSEAALLDATRANPKWPDPWVNLAQLRKRLGRRADMADAWSRAHERGAELSAADAFAAGSNLASRAKYHRAVPLLTQAAAAFPDHAETQYALGVSLQRTYALDAAEAAFRRAVAKDPDHAEAWNNLGNVLKAQVRFAEAVDAYRAALRAEPGKLNTHRNLVFALQYDPDRTGADVYEAHRAYGLRFADPLPPLPVERALSAGTKERPLRVGFVSSDLGSHPVGYFLAPVLEHLDRDAFVPIAYAGPRPADALTTRLRARMAAWVPTDDLDDDALAARIRADRIDVLFDLGGHTRGSRVQVFAKKPAPVQVTWAGYVGTTGLPTMDWILADARQLPPELDRYQVERVWRMPRSYVCWEPPAAPPPGPLPMSRTASDGAPRGPTLGCLNNLPKLNRRVIALWSRILVARPDARLLLVTKSLGDVAMQERWRRWFAEEGVDPARIEMSGRIPRDEVLRTYGERIDLALDPFPYAGGLTTLEALWMGVPVVTRGDGDRMASRHSVGHLGACGIDGFVARDPDDYVRIALRWLADPHGLAAVRASCRDKMRASVLCDGAGYTREWQDAVRGLWIASVGRRVSG